MKTQEIVKYKKEICGVNTEYSFFRVDEMRYQICICRGDTSEKAEFGGDFFSIGELFKIIVDTNTMPENLPEIACDIKNSFCV